MAWFLEVNQWWARRSSCNEWTKWYNLWNCLQWSLYAYVSVPSYSFISCLSQLVLMWSAWSAELIELMVDTFWMGIRCGAQMVPWLKPWYCSSNRYGWHYLLLPLFFLSLHFFCFFSFFSIIVLGCLCKNRCCCSCKRNHSIYHREGHARVRGVHLVFVLNLQ